MFDSLRDLKCPLSEQQCNIGTALQVWRTDKRKNGLPEALTYKPANYMGFMSQLTVFFFK